MFLAKGTPTQKVDRLTYVRSSHWVAVQHSTASLNANLAEYSPRADANFLPLLHHVGGQLKPLGARTRCPSRITKLETVK